MRSKDLQLREKFMRQISDSRHSSPALPRADGRLVRPFCDRRLVSCISKSHRRLHLMQQFHQPRKSLLPRRLIPRHRIRRILARPHESVSRAIIRHRVIHLSRRLHRRRRIRNRRPDPRIVPCIKPIHRRRNRRNILRPRTVKHKCSRQLLPVRRERKALAATPAEAHHRNLPVARRQMLSIIRRGIQVTTSRRRDRGADTAFTAASWPRELAPRSSQPRPGPNPSARSGAITMNPCAASSSAISLAQSVNPKISWISTTTGALAFTSGYTTKACTVRLPCFSGTYS